MTSTNQDIDEFLDKMVEPYAKNLFKKKINRLITEARMDEIQKMWDSGLISRGELVVRVEELKATRKQPGERSENGTNRPK